MKKIKIFVSHRIDLDSVVINNPLYVPVRCGAVFDKRENITMLGDDTGDNISEKRNSFCEFTVQYWAWKNVEADYYGLCHYRRYLSFKKKDIYAPNQKIGYLDSMTTKNLEYCNLLNENSIRKEIESADILTTYKHHLADDPKYCGQWNNILEKWLDYGRKYLDKQAFDIMLELIKTKYPDYYKSAIEYMHGKYFIGFNCFIMKKEAFFDLCKFEFEILFELEKRLKNDHYSETKMRTPGYIGEWLYSIWIFHHKLKKDYVIKEKQLVFFGNSTIEKQLKPFFKKNNNAIVYILNDNNINDIGVSIESLISNSKMDNTYDIIILHKSFNSDSWENLLKNNKYKVIEELAKNKINISIRFYDPKNEIMDLDIRENNKQNFEEKYYPLLLPWILANFQKAVLISENMIINTNINDIFNEKLDNQIIKGTKDLYFIGQLSGFKKDLLGKYENFYKNINPYDFVSTDILYYNLDAFRRDYEQIKIIKFIRTSKFINKDIDPINILLKDKIGRLSFNWNKFTVVDKTEFMIINDFIPSEDYKEYLANTDVKIWNKRKLGKKEEFLNQIVQNLYWKYAKETPFYEEILLSKKNEEKGNNNINNLNDLLNIIFPKYTKRRDVLKNLHNKIFRIGW